MVLRISEIQLYHVIVFYKAPSERRSEATKLGREYKNVLEMERMIGDDSPLMAVVQTRDMKPNALLACAQHAIWACASAASCPASPR